MACESAIFIKRKTNNMEKQKVTIYDVAHQAQVSMATVSRVVNGNSNVKPLTRKKVLKVIKDLNYHPNAVARGLASKRTTTVGVITPNVADTYFSELALGIDDIAAMYKYNIILANSDDNSKKEIHVLNTLLTKQVDGIIFMGNEITDALRKKFREAKTPIVLAGSIDSKKTEPSVNIDYRQATKDEVSHLIERGNKHIAFVTGSLDQAINSKHRLLGYQDALKKYQLPYDPKLVFSTDRSYHSGYKLSQRLIKLNVSAAMVSNDELAAGVMNGLTDSGIRIPDQFEIATSDDTKLTKMTRPTMTSITQPLYDIGAVAMRLLTKIMNKDKITNQDVLLPYGLIKRNSTK